MKNLLTPQNFRIACGLLLAMVVAWFLPLAAPGVLYAFMLPSGTTFDQHIKGLKEQRVSKRNEMQKMLDLALKEERNMTEEEQKKYDKLESERRNLATQLELAEEAFAEERKKPSVPIPGARNSNDGGISDDDKKDISKYSFLKIVRAAVKKEGLTGIEKEMAEEASNEMQRAGATPNSIYQIPLVVLRNMNMLRNVEKRDVDATSSSGAAGGYNIATELKGYIEALRERSRVVQLGADYITGAVGNIDMPRENGVFAPGWAATENANASESNPTYTKVSFTPKRLAGYMDVSNQLLAQTSAGFENRLRNQLLAGSAEAIDQGAINGAGSSGEPEGILQTTGIGDVIGGTNGAAPDRDDLIDLWTKVAQAKGLQGSLAYLSNPQVFSKLAKTKTDSGSGIFVLDKNKEFMGYNFAVSNHVPSDLDKGTSTGVCSAIIFGNWNDLMAVQWGGMEILPDPYTQAIAGLTRMHINTFVDIHVLRAGSFAAMKDATTT